MVEGKLDTLAVVAALKRDKRIIRKPRCSVLTRYGSELLVLYAKGATVADLKRWLQQHHIKVAHSTISRWLIKNS